MAVRKLLTVTETVLAGPFAEGGRPITRVAAMAVIENPLAGRHASDLTPLFEIARDVAPGLVEAALAQLPNPAVSYGKAAIVGVNGEMEHGGALIHPRLGAPMRAAVGGGKALIASNAKVAAMGAAIDLPLGHKDDAWSFDHFDTMTLIVPDAPRPNEIVLCLAYADGGRMDPRCGDKPLMG